MTKRISDEKMASIVREYQLSTLTQSGFCFTLKATEGIIVAPRTLRAWCQRFGQSFRSLEEIDQAIADALQRFEAMFQYVQALAAAAKAAAAPAEPSVEMASPIQAGASEVLPPRQNDTEAASENAPPDVDAPGTVLRDQSATQADAPSAEEPMRMPRKKRIDWSFV